MRYLKDAGLGSGERAMVVDIGWRGSIEDNLARMMPHLHFEGCYLGLERRRPSAANASKAAYAVDLDLSYADADLVSYVAPLEFLCGATLGSVVGYTEECDGTIRPVLRAATGFAHDAEVVAFQGACVEEVARLFRSARLHALSSQSMLPAARRAWRRIIRHPDPEVARAFLAAELDASFGLAERQRPGGPARGLARRLSPGDRIRQLVRRAPWPHALCHDEAAGALERIALPVLVRALRKIEQLRRGKFLPARLSWKKLFHYIQCYLVVNSIRIERYARRLKALQNYRGQ